MRRLFVEGNDNHIKLFDLLQLISQFEDKHMRMRSVETRNIIQFEFVDQMD